MADTDDVAVSAIVVESPDARVTDGAPGVTVQPAPGGVPVTASVELPQPVSGFVIVAV